MKDIELTGPVTITLSPQEVQLVVVGLKELPYKLAQPVLEHVFQACQPKVDEAAPCTT